jgi:predicted RNA binding protein YcfA (HicA-like mRNA interferase family)
MKRKQSVEQLKSGKELLGHARRSENYDHERVSGSHHTVYSKQGGFVVIPVHGNKDLATGTRNSIVKRMIAIGLALITMLVAMMIWFGGSR